MVTDEIQPPTERLQRDPSLWFEARSYAVLGLIPLLITSLVWLGVTGKIGSQRVNDIRDLEWWIWVVVALVTLISLNFAMMVAHKIRRAISGAIPIVDVSRQPWRPGQKAQVRIADPDVGSIDAWDVDLEARAVESQRGPEGGRTYSMKVQHQARWLTLSKNDLGSSGRLERLLTVDVPREATGHPKWSWLIVVRGWREKNGVRMEVHGDSYPLRVEAGGREQPDTAARIHRT